VDDVIDYIQKLRRHDWDFEFSDDHMVWHRGTEERNELRRLAAIFDPYLLLWNTWAPVAHRRNSTERLNGS
jgi:hypothetical protein